MALPVPGFYTSTGGVITTHDFGSVEAGAYKPDSTGWSFRLYNALGSTDSDPMTSVKMSIRDTDGGIDEIWTQQHWIQVKSDGSSTGTGMVDDAQTVFTAVGKNKELSLGDIPSGEYRTLYARCYPPTDAAEQDVDFQLRATYQDPATSICNWITGLRGNGVVASTGTPFAMSTGGTSGTIPYDAGYALIYNNEIYYGSSGSYDITTTGSSTGYSIYLDESGSFGETTGSVASNQLLLYNATISSGVCTAVVDKRVYLAGLQSGTTGAMPTTPDLGDLYLDIINGKLYAAKTAGNWTVIVPGATFVALTDTPADYTGDASKILTVTTGENAVEFTSSTGIALDSFGTPSTGTSLNATTGRHGLLPILSGSSGEYLDGDGNFAVIPASDVEVSEIGTATYDDMQDFIDNTQSGGRVSGGTISDDSSGGITISSGAGFTKTTTGDIGLTQSFDWSAEAIVSTGLTDDSINYVYMDYNSGSPQILATADRTTIRLQDQFTLGRVYKDGTDIHIINSGVNLYNATRRMHEAKIEVLGFQRASGGVISESAVTERALDSTEGIFFLGDNEMITSAKDTSTGGSDFFTSWYYVDSAWASSTGQQQIDNTNYNDISATGLIALTPSRYGVHWTYIHYDGDIQTVYGQGDYSLTQAENAAIPDSLPSVVSDFGTLTAKIILQKTSTGFTSIVTAYKTLFPVSTPSDHNDLGGLDIDNYQHLTSAEHDEITQWAGAVTLSTGGAVNLVEFSTGGTVNVPSGQEYQINGSKVKLDEWATPTTGTTLNSSTGRHGLLIALDGTTGNYLRGDGTWVTPPAAAGEANTASNAGTTGIGIYYQKAGVDLEFKAIHSTGNILVTDSTGTITVNLDVDSTGIALDSLGTPSTGTTLDSSTGRHGLLPKLSGNAYDVINGDGSWKTSDQVRNITTKSTTGTLAITEAGLVCVSATGAYTLTMPAASGNSGLTYHIKKTDFNYNAITFAGASTGNLFNYENAASAMQTTYPRINTGGAEATFLSDGTNWQVIDEAMGQRPYAHIYLNNRTQEDFEVSLRSRISFDTAETDIGSISDVSSWITDTATATTPDHLIDTTNNPFTDDMLGCEIKNSTGETYAHISVVNSASDVTLTADIFASGETYLLKHAKVIIPIPGLYQLEYRLYIKNTVASQQYNIYISKDYTTDLDAFAAYTVIAGKYLTLQSTVLYPLTATDIIELRNMPYDAAGDTSDVWGAANAGYTYLKVRLVSKD